MHGTPSQVSSLRSPSPWSQACCCRAPTIRATSTSQTWWLHTQPHDLSFYGAFQAFAAGGSLFMLIFFAPLYTGDRFYYAGVALFGLAKLCEIPAMDRGLFEAIGISGHTLKHLLAAGASVMVVTHVARRKAIVPSV